MTGHWPDAPCACHHRGGYCMHRDADRQVGVDSMGWLYEACEACGKTWVLAVLSPERAAVARWALANGLPLEGIG